MQLLMQASFTPVAKQWTRNAEKATAVALTRTAWDLQRALTDEMRSVFDRPTPFTLRAFRVEMAKASDLEATVWAAPQQAKYLFWEAEGGERSTKPFERKMHLFGGQVALPGAGAKLNQYGNMSRQFIQSVTNDTNTSGSAKRFFVGTPKGWLNDGTFEGVWARVDDNHRLVRLMSFAEEADYKKRFDVSAIGKSTVDRVFESQLLKAMKQFGMEAGQ